MLNEKIRSRPTVTISLFTELISNRSFLYGGKQWWGWGGGSVERCLTCNCQARFRLMSDWAKDEPAD